MVRFNPVLDLPLPLVSHRFTSGNPRSLPDYCGVCTFPDQKVRMCTTVRIVVFLRVIHPPYRIIVGVEQFLSGNITPKTGIKVGFKPVYEPLSLFLPKVSYSCSHR